MTSFDSIGLKISILTWKQLSFFGWEFLSVFTMGILSIWLQPYIIASEVIFMNEITKNKK